MNALRTVLPLRSLSASRAWFWLVRPEAGDAAAALSLFLLQGVPGLLDALRREVVRLG